MPDFTLLNNPLVWTALGAIAMALSAIVVAAVVKVNKPAAQDVADYSEAAEEQIRRYSEAAVKAAEMFGVTEARNGRDKMLYALDFLQAEMKKNGVVGDPSRVTEARLRADLEAALRRVINNPKKAA
jgi:hypothetical protein